MLTLRHQNTGSRDFNFSFTMLSLKLVVFATALLPLLTSICLILDLGAQ